MMDCELLISPIIYIKLFLPQNEIVVVVAEPTVGWFGSRWINLLWKKYRKKEVIINNKCFISFIFFLSQPNS
jgi:hypothetical protein